MSKFQKIGSVVGTIVAAIGQAGVVFAQSDIRVVNPTQVGGSSFSAIITIIKTVGGWMMTLAGALAVIYLIYGGIMYITGGEKGAEKAKTMIINSITGLVIVALSYLIANMVLNAIGA
ncbi:hypothetical protein A2810_03290 [candidate division Kazan bacterium RIFCSPHIGHO2_01_FULL_49_10]|uniref:Uncharacterized protein n=1 Tax=candidate division Kazan bacterium RIFCSPLOWO2_01_FULL_48_13 TaxID=1798539 RepID=A0A1F4PPA2_UNCK3|nr:MAG: hypothetical protein A2810_03290 [candidate division Kazan bacterium RIFCSPHIGHO2_01_FULL_49_10]OGB85459.1 MAG: hypothetical protein A2994_02470 [candidate division Kazan bacterium RIFCSPLOWO2_01_FULL_48_13]